MDIKSDPVSPNDRCLTDDAVCLLKPQKAHGFDNIDQSWTVRQNNKVGRPTPLLARLVKHAGFQRLPSMMRRRGAPGIIPFAPDALKQ